MNWEIWLKPRLMVTMEGEAGEVVVKSLKRGRLFDLPFTASRSGFKSPAWAPGTPPGPPCVHSNHNHGDYNSLELHRIHALSRHVLV
jgi:hypothetical protein